MGETTEKFGTVSEKSVRLVIDAGPEADAEETDRLARLLGVELADLDVESVAFASEGVPPEGAKAADPVTVGAIIVALSASGGVLAGLIAIAQDWLSRQGARKRIEVTIEGETLVLERATSQERDALVAAYLRRHGGGQAG
ncbi:hypothetical protein ACIA8C_01885 [Nocardia sp. NPDC051321]|uniref:hypothetical protein n=1 Tax=Nocardia sp. NPDC051321 TaxID=3364323 RepID=UPI0037A9E2D7